VSGPDLLTGPVPSWRVPTERSRIKFAGIRSVKQRDYAGDKADGANRLGAQPVHKRMLTGLTYTRSFTDFPTASANATKVESLGS
jgi:hypothetical protein